MIYNMLLKFSSLTEMRPSIASFISTLAIGGPAAVWMDVIKGWAAFFTVLLGVPTAILILIYWALKVRNEWKNRKDNS